jgi:hypothetical protein
VPFALRIVLPFDDVEGEGSVVTGHTIGAVEIEEEVADPEG